MYELIQGDCLQVLPKIAGYVDAVVSDPPYGMNWDTDARRFSGGNCKMGKKVHLTEDIIGDDQPFDPSPWLAFPKVILFGSNHFAQRLPVGTTLVWVKKPEHLHGTFLSDAEIAWMKGGYGVYCFEKQFPPPSRMFEAGGKVAHPTQKPISLMSWCIGKLKLEPGATILDPYMGSGTTGIAALKGGFNFIGIEIDPKHFATAQRRIREAETPLFADSHA